MRIMKVTLRIAVFFLATCQFAFSQNDLQSAKGEFPMKINEFTGGQNLGDILFLIDTSDSLSHSQFLDLKQFVKNFLNMIIVSIQTIRVEVIPFGTTASLYIDQVSNPYLNKNKCTFQEKLNAMDQSINGGQRNVNDAFQLAYDVCLGKYSGQKRGPLSRIKTIVILLINGPWNGPCPIPIAKNLHAANVEVFAIGIGIGAGVDRLNLQRVVKNPTKQVFFLENFLELGELSNHLRGDPIQHNWQTTTVTPDKCNYACDPIARCACGLVYGDYKCACPRGYSGSGTAGQCQICPASTYKDFDGYALSCSPCPANSGHSITGSTTIFHCQCFEGHAGTPQLGHDCTRIQGKKRK